MIEKRFTRVQKILADLNFLTTDLTIKGCKCQNGGMCSIHETLEDMENMIMLIGRRYLDDVEIVKIIHMWLTESDEEMGGD